MNAPRTARPAPAGMVIYAARKYSMYIDKQRVYARSYSSIQIHSPGGCRTGGKRPRHGRGDCLHGRASDRHFHVRPAVYIR